MGGNNAALSLMWSTSPDAPNLYKEASHKRWSELKLVQDFGARQPQYAQYGHPTPAPTPPPQMTVAPLLQQPRGFLTAAAARAAKGGDSDQLSQAHHERSIGQMYLRCGNLKQARKHLKRAEQLLKPPKEAMDVEQIDEFKMSKRDTFA